MGLFLNKVLNMLFSNFILIVMMVLYVPYKIQCYDPDYATYHYHEMKRIYGLVDPYQLPEENTKFLKIELIKDCDNCPRVYYPTCAYNGVTYVNICLMRCLNQTKRRDGPCIIYRRGGGNTVSVAIPRKWRITE